MRNTLGLFLFITICSNSSFSQSSAYDKGTRDTLALIVTTPPLEGINVSIAIEAWVYSDDTILSYSAGFKWHNHNMRIDSARAAGFLRTSGFGIFLYHHDHIISSNQSHIFQLGGFNLHSNLPPDASGRRKWATYYFTLSSWQIGDTIAISLLPENETEFAFVVPGQFYPHKVQPHFDDPILFPGIGTSIEDEALLPSDFALHQNFPNPFNPQTTIRFQLPKKDHVQLEIFDILGRKISTLFNGIKSAGSHAFEWNGQTNSGQSAPSGIYFYRLATSETSVTKKMVLVK